MMDLSYVRREYEAEPLLEEAVDTSPFKQFETWFNEAKNTSIQDVTAASLATVTADGQPQNRIILVKEFSESGFIFYTHSQSQKTTSFSENPKVSLQFYWDQLNRQVRLQGTVTPISSEKTKAYFYSRPKASQVSASISQQSHVVSREALQTAYQEALKKYENKDVPFPTDWSGYCVTPTQFEFWQGQPNRLHDRLVYFLEGNEWKIERIAP